MHSFKRSIGTRIGAVLLVGACTPSLGCGLLGEGRSAPDAGVGEDGGGGVDPRGGEDSGVPGPRLGISLDDIDLDFVVDNDQPFARHETYAVSIPFPESRVWSLERLGVEGHQTAWLPLQFWSDGSYRVAQAQFTTVIPAQTKQTFRVVVNQQAVTGSFQPHPSVAARWSQFRLGARIHDGFDHRYEAELDGPGDLAQESALRRVRRWHVYHRSTSGAGAGIGRDFLTSTFYVEEYRDVPFVVIDWIVGNDYQGRDAPADPNDPNLFPLGPIDVSYVGLFTRGAAELEPYRPEWHDIRAPSVEGDGRKLLQVMDADHFGDGQTRRYRFLAYLEDPSASESQRAAWRESFRAFAKGPARTLAVLDAWRKTEALGLLGGPVVGLANAAARAQDQWSAWLGNAASFGRWGSFGDLTNTGVAGTPRNGPLGDEIAHAVQSGDLRLLTILEQKAWVQAVRPYHLWQLTVGDEENLMFFDGLPMSLYGMDPRDLSPESLGRRAIQAADPLSQYRTRARTSPSVSHGFNAFDGGHWSTDFLFEHWTVTGDEWARDELRLLGQCAKGSFRVAGNFYSSQARGVRDEAWAMQSFVQVYQATRDESIKRYALRRLREVVNRDRLRAHPSRAFVLSPPDPRLGIPGDDYRGYTVWAHAFILYAYTGAYKLFDESDLLSAAEDAARAIEYAWIRNYLDPTTGIVRPWGTRIFCLVEYEGQPVAADHLDASGVVPNFASHGVDVVPGSALQQLARYSSDPWIDAVASEMSLAITPTLGEQQRWEKWWFLADGTLY